MGNCADKYSPKVIRSAMGAAFRVNLISVENDVDVFKKHFNQISIFVASLTDSIPIKEIKPTTHFGLIVDTRN